MDNSRKLLIDCVGEKGLEKITKSIIRRKTNSMADPLELYLPLLVVPRTIISWLTQNILPMAVGEHKEFQFPGKEDVTMLIEKMDTDVYRGEFYKGGKMIHRFDHQTLPSISGHLLTVLELYSHLDKEHGLKEVERPNDGSNEMIAQIMAMNNIKPPQAPAELHHATTNKMLDMLGKLIDVLVADKLAKDKLHGGKADNMSAKDFDTKKLKEGIAHESEHTDDKKVAEEIAEDHLVEDPDYYKKIKELEMKKEELAPAPKKKSYFKGKLDKMAKAIEAPSGAGMPNAPKMPKPAVPPGNKPQAQANKQAQLSAKGKIASSVSKPPSAPKAPKSPTQGSPTKSPALSSPTMKSPAVKSNALKSELTKSWHKKKLEKIQKAQMFKTETFHYCSESQLYKKCKLCKTPEFAKTEQGPKYSPCACYRVTDKPNFLTLKKSGEGYLLKFDSSVEIDVVDSILKTLRG